MGTRYVVDVQDRSSGRYQGQEQRFSSSNEACSYMEGLRHGLRGTDLEPVCWEEPSGVCPSGWDYVDTELDVVIK